jgi:glycosyltransferase involved in cell wall biosynthesis
MRFHSDYDLTYVTIDSVSEGVGSSQIVPLLRNLSRAGLRIQLISFEKTVPEPELRELLASLRVDWNLRPFGSYGFVGGISRFMSLRSQIPQTRLVHARSDISTVAALSQGHDKVLWDVRSLWADQKVIIQDTKVNKSLYNAYRKLENYSAHHSLGMSTLTNAIVPILEERNNRIPQLKTMVTTSVDTDVFKSQQIPPKKIQVLFSGTYNNYYDLELSKVFLKGLKKRVPIETHWARPVESSTRSLGVGETKIIASSQHQMANLIPSYSFGVSICKIQSGPSLKAAMPTKLGEFLACGRPIVVNKGLGDMDEYLEKYNIGVALDDNPYNLEESIDNLLRILLDKSTPDRCRYVAEKYFSMESGTRNYLDLYTRMLGHEN